MDIVEEIRRDRESGAKRLEAEYKAGLMTLARRFCHDTGDAEELVNRTFAAVVEGIDDYLEQSAFFAWMCQILTNIHSLDTRRKSNSEVVYPGEIPEVADDDAQEAIYRNLDASLLREAIKQLPDDIRKAVVLHYFMDIPVREMARVLMIPTGTVAWRLHCAREMLAAKLGVAAEKVKDAAKKPGAKATLLTLALCALTALGAVWWGELSERATSGETGGSRSRATAGTGGATSTLPTVAADGDPPATAVPVVPIVADVPSTTFPKDSTMNTTTRSAALGAATALALAAAPPAASADGYQYIVSGYPAASASHSGVSAGTSLAVGLLGGNSASSALEARRLTIGDSAGTALDSTKCKAMVIILR